MEGMPNGEEFLAKLNELSSSKEDKEKEKEDTPQVKSVPKTKKEVLSQVVSNKETITVEPNQETEEEKMEEVSLSYRIEQISKGLFHYDDLEADQETRLVALAKNLLKTLEQ